MLLSVVEQQPAPGRLQVLELLDLPLGEAVPAGHVDLVARQLLLDPQLGDGVQAFVLLLVLLLALHQLQVLELLLVGQLDPELERLGVAELAPGRPQLGEVVHAGWVDLVARQPLLIVLR